jgi:hypothetical protein
MSTMLARARAATGFSSLLAACTVTACLLCGPADVAAKGKAQAAKAGAEITFTGYQSLPGHRGVVFVELTEVVEVEVTRVGQVVEYRFVGASVPLRNNKNPLLLRDFDSSAVSAVLRTEPRKKGRDKYQPRSTRLVITLRGAASPTYRMLQRGKGAVFEVQLPAAGT